MTYEIQASVREAQGTGASRRLRREGQIPAFCTVKVKSLLQSLWITKPYSTHWKKNLSILR